MKKAIMKGAWKIAREGQKKFGGKVSEYFAEALKQAWAIVKKATDRFEYNKRLIKIAVERYNEAIREYNKRGNNAVELNIEELLAAATPANAKGIEQKILDRLGSILVYNCENKAIA